MTAKIPWSSETTWDGRWYFLRMGKECGYVTHLEQFCYATSKLRAGRNYLSRLRGISVMPLSDLRQGHSMGDPRRPLRAQHRALGYNTCRGPCTSGTPVHCHAHSGTDSFWNIGTLLRKCRNILVAKLGKWGCSEVTVCKC